MRAIKLETARILFSSDVFAVVAVVTAKALSFFFYQKLTGLLGFLFLNRVYIQLGVQASFLS